MARCPSCNHEHELGALYCSRCGKPVGAVLSCEACGASNRADQRFCGDCGRELRPGRGVAVGAAGPTPAAGAVPWARGGVPGERKQVTVMFADVKGSMDLSGSVDVEQWWTIMQRFFAVLAEGVERFEGRVDRFTGDGVMAVFGAPSALEDHARRACHAALTLQAELAVYARELSRERGLSLAVRMGLNSGEVVAGTIGDELSAEYAAIGHTAGLAQRMESLAEPGGVFLTESTARLVRGFFMLEERGTMQVKGLAEPLGVFALTGDLESRAAFAMSVARGLSGFVGREDELDSLQRALTRARAGEGQVAAVVGEAGIGKTRLCHEFLERCRAEGIAIWKAHALAHMRAVPFAPMLELLRDFFDIARSDEERVARERVVTRLGALGDTGAGSLQLLLEFLGIPDPGHPPLHLDPEARQRRLLAASERLLCARDDGATAVILLEDLHWLDSSSEALLENLAAGVQGTRTLLLATYRSEHRAVWMPAAHSSELRLNPLGSEAGRSLLEQLLGTDPSLDGVAPLVYEHADGNPFFMEEIVKTLAEGGTLQGAQGAYRLTRTIDTIEIPATVQSVLAARIDRLTEDEKRTLQIAAVIGRHFSAAVLGRLVGLSQEAIDRVIAGLLATELILPGSAEGEFVFKHSLAERVAYRSQLARPRARAHAAVATALAELYPERRDELAALIAHHWESAGDFLAAAQWCARAAGWAGFSDPGEALRQWQKARELADAAEESPRRAELALATRVMLLNLGWRQGVPESMPREDYERETAELYEQASELARAAHNLTFETITVAAYGAVRGVAGHLEDMADFGMRALRLADGAADHGLMLSVLPCAVYGLHGLGRYVQILELLEEMSAGFPEDPAAVVGVTMVCPYAWVLCWQAAANAHAGGLPQAFSGFERALAVARERGDTETEGWIHFSMVQAMQLAGSGEALEHARAAQEIAERRGGAFSQGHAWRYLGIAHVVGGEWTAAIGALQQALTVWRARRVGLEAEPHALTMLARAQLGLGDPETACVTAQEAVALAMSRHTASHEIEARLALAGALRQSSGLAAAGAAEGHLRRIRSLLADTGALTLEPRVHAELAECAALRGDSSTRELELDEARRLFTQVGAPVLAERTRAASSTDLAPSP